VSGFPTPSCAVPSSKRPEGPVRLKSWMDASLPAFE
jgi:hypothetical protein